MQLRNNILALLIVFSGMLGAGEWTTESAGFDFDPSQGRGTLHGPVTLKFGGWTFSSSREALVTAKSRIVRKAGSNAAREYGLLKEPARVVFLGKGRVKNGNGDTVLEAPFLILSMEDMTVMAKGAGIVVRDGSNKLVSGNDESGVVIDLMTGAILRSGPGW